MKKKLFIIFVFLISSLAFGTSKDLIEIAENENHTIEDVYLNFNQFRNYYRSTSDRRVLFVKISNKITFNIEELVKSGQVLEGPWLIDIVIAFAEEYRKAVLNYESKNLADLPLPWRFDFDHSKSKTIGLATQLMLSLNSHILHDLPMVVSKNTSSQYDLYRYERDYFKLNEMFNALTPVLFSLVYKEANQTPVGYFHPAEVIKRKVVDTLVVSMRKVAWKRALKMASMKNKFSKEDYIKHIAWHTLKMSELVVDLDPFLSAPPGDILPNNVLKNTWVAIDKIYDALELESPGTDLSRWYLKSLLTP